MASTRWEPIAGVTEASLEFWHRVVLGGNMNSLGVPRKMCILLGLFVSQLRDPIIVLDYQGVGTRLVNSRGAGKLSGVNSLSQGDWKPSGGNSRAGSKLSGMMRKSLGSGVSTHRLTRMYPGMSGLGLNKLIQEMTSCPRTLRRTHKLWKRT